MREKDARGCSGLLDTCACVRFCVRVHARLPIAHPLASVCSLPSPVLLASLSFMSRWPHTLAQHYPGDSAKACDAVIEKSWDLWMEEDERSDDITLVCAYVHQ